MSALPPSLTRFEWQLERATRRHERRRRIVVRSAAAATVVATLGAAGSVVALVGSESPPASAIVLAQAALTGSDDAVLHVVERTTLTGPNGATSTSRTESWQVGDGSDWRQVSYDGSGTRGREHGITAGRPVVYNPLTDTIHTTPPEIVVPSHGPDGESGRLLETMRNAVATGEAYEDGETTIAGRRAIRIVTNDGNNVLFVDAETGRPVQWQSGVEGTGGVYDTATTRIETYEWLPANETTRALASVAAQHPDAAVLEDGTIEGIDGPKGR
jgi:hypothetical protein